MIGEGARLSTANPTAVGLLPWPYVSAGLAF